MQPEYLEHVTKTWLRVDTLDLAVSKCKLFSIRNNFWIVIPVFKWQILPNLVMDNFIEKKVSTITISYTIDNFSG